MLGRTGMLAVAFSIHVVAFISTRIRMDPSDHRLEVLQLAALFLAETLYMYILFDYARGSPESRLERLPESGPNALRAGEIQLSEIPNEMLCPLSGCIMTEPVYFEGKVNRYERTWIERSLELKKRDPLTTLSASVDQLKLDTELQIKINDFLKQEEDKYSGKQNTAATLIQAHFRGFFTRKKIRAATSKSAYNTFVSPCR